MRKSTAKDAKVSQGTPMANRVDVDEKTNRLLRGIGQLIEQTGKDVAVYLNTAVSRLYWSIGSHIITELHYETYSEYGQQILATVSQRLSERFGKGYSYSALTRMMKVAEASTFSILENVGNDMFNHKEHQDLHKGHKGKNSVLCETFVSLVFKKEGIAC